MQKRLFARIHAWTRKLMVPEKQLSLKRTVPFLLVGILIFVAYLYFFVGIPEIVTIIQSVNLVYYFLAVAVLFLNMLTNSLTWQYFLRLLSNKVPLYMHRSLC